MRRHVVNREQARAHIHDELSAVRGEATPGHRITETIKTNEAQTEVGQYKICPHCSPVLRWNTEVVVGRRSGLTSRRARSVHKGKEKPLVPYRCMYALRRRLLCSSTCIYLPPLRRAKVEERGNAGGDKRGGGKKVARRRLKYARVRCVYLP